ncbi:glycoside hydrolase family 47 protein [Backusella circina FSU 941]|nr:glycoside hydrolase family 47 protein [Backusella circina FSU 941]
MFVQLSKIPYRWRTVLLLSIGIILCIRFLYNHDFAIPLSPEANLLKSTYLNQTSNNKMKLANPIHGFDHFESRLPKIQTTFDPESRSDRKEREERREAVKTAFLHGWKGYKTYALGHDELKPISNQINNPFGGFGATLIDSLSTMLVMELFDEFEQVLPIIQNKSFIVDEDISVFESIIRYMGGLLSAYELSEHPNKITLLHKAEELGLALLPAFDTPYGIPYHKFNTEKNQGLNNETFLADIATVQLEFLTLSYHTGNPVFAEKAQTITDFLDKAGYAEGLYLSGLYPNHIDVAEGHFTDTTASFGGMGDSAYEVNIYIRNLIKASYLTLFFLVLFKRIHFDRRKNKPIWANV